MLSGGAIACGVGFFETEIVRIEFGGTKPCGLPHQSQLPARLHAGSHRGGLSGRDVVPQLHTGRVGTNYPGTFNWRKHCGGICFCEEWAAPVLSMNCRFRRGRRSDSRWQRHWQSRAASQLAADLRSRFTQGGALADSRFAWAQPPLQGFQFGASPTIELSGI
jgi:hypothetical protein